MKRENDRTRNRVLLKGQPGMRLQTFSNRHLAVPSDGMVELSAEDADPLIRQGWTKIAELPEDELPGCPDEYLEQRDEPQGPKSTTLSARWSGRPTE